ncbi:hypothetical protein FZEAL_9076 [Fusarium zealandicum]|uniref:Carbohydrate kinase PfkB domain-containing protein n=1 Tax=Fusarium zealandicum TaxID=1053134 RepID=A0A8H4XG84_9HYPO|nr:hypothetical protein FZEAL_9076 [Fusarium zealandicum]
MTFSKTRTEQYTPTFLDTGIGDTSHDTAKGIIVVRCGEHGCLTLTKAQKHWLPAFYSITSPKIVDTTGAGNAFLGAFAMGLQTTGDPREAAILGTVASSFALEQIGLPRYSPAAGLSDET